MVEIKQLQAENEALKAKVAEQGAFIESLGKLLHDANNFLGIIHMTSSAIKSTIPEAEHAKLVNSVKSTSGIMQRIADGCIKSKVLLK
ncbi:MAG: hypothetical protein WCH10_06335 [bacterium]